MERPIFPEFKVIDPIARIKKIGRFMADRLYSDVPAVPRGAAAMLDQALDEQPQLFGYDDMGCYIDRTIPDIAGREL